MPMSTYFNLNSEFPSKKLKKSYIKLKPFQFNKQLQREEELDDLKKMKYLHFSKN